MSHRMRPADRYTTDDAGLYPPPIGDFSRGRPRSRTLGEDALPPRHAAVGAAPRGFATEEAPARRRSYARDDYVPGPVRGPGMVDDRRPDHRRYVGPTPPEPDHRPRHREPKYPSPPRHARAGDVPQYEYEPALSKRAKSIASRRLPEQSPPRYRRYESPEPIQRQRRATRYESRDMPRDTPRDSKHGGRYDDYERPERSSPRDRGLGRDLDRSLDPRRVRTAHVPAYEDGYRPLPRRRGSLDGMDRGHAPRRPYSRPSPSPAPGPRPRHRSVPPKTKEAAKQGVLAGIAWQSVARTAFTVGAQAAFKARKDPSPWLGEKGARVATAAISAALVDGFIATKHPDKMDSKRHKGLKSATTAAMNKGVAEGLARRHR